MKTYHKAPAFGWLAVASALLSVLACYGTLGAIAALSLVGVTLAINTHAWAAAIVTLAVASAFLVALNAIRTRTIAPLALAVVGAALLVWVMYGSYNRIVEVAGFALLLGTALWEHRLRKCTPLSYDLREERKC